MTEPVLTEPTAGTASAAAASALIALAERAPSRARAAMAAALAELAPEDWTWLRVLYRGHAHSPSAALARVLATAAARLGTVDTRPLDQRSGPFPGVEVPVEVEVGDWVRGPVRQDCYDLRLHAEPSPATDAMRTTDEAIAHRARHRPARHPGIETVAAAVTGTGTGDRLVA
ncbi:hypothetical protein [Nocardia abscessus]|uniref:hypothetical protein n=1 Tax=Nocardia abscessus TaxID=120957 RepID=UPI00245587F0|nr:hypothetical protein [Nocardia abscessus]